MEPAAAPLIMGVGDEVTLVAGVAVLVLALVLAWLSTYVADGSSQLLGTGDAAVIRLGPLPPYAGPAGAAEAPEPPRAPENAEEKTEEEGAAAAQGDSGSPPDPGLEQLLDVRSLSQGAAEPGAPGAGDVCPGLIKIRLKFLNDTEEVAVARPEDTVGILKRSVPRDRGHEERCRVASTPPQLLCPPAANNPLPQNGGGLLSLLLCQKYRGV